MKIFSTAFFRNWASGYETEQAGAGRGVFFVNYLRSLVRNHWAVWSDWQLVIHHDDRATEFPYELVFGGVAQLLQVSGASPCSAPHRMQISSVLP